MRFAAVLALLVAAPILAAPAPGAAPPPVDPTRSLYDATEAALGDGYRDIVVIRGAHTEATGNRSHRRYYTRTWDLGDLPAYRPLEQVSGTIIATGGYLALGSVGEYWREGIRKFQPNLKVVIKGEGRAGGGPIVSAEVSEFSTGPRMSDRFEALSKFESLYRHPPLEIEWATGSYDVPGWSPALAIFVKRDNPLARLTVRQLDGIFGGARAGGWDGTTWHPEWARGPGGNIRTWGQLGLTGRWADQPIHIYGRPIRNYGIQRNLEREAMQGGDLWNDNLREYAHEARPDGTRYISSVEMVRDLARDPYGIAFSDMGSFIPEVKLVSIAGTEGGPYIPLTIETLRSRSYPLNLAQWTVVNYEPGKPLAPRVREFLRYMLSREGQEAIQRDGKWLPLPASVVRAELGKLENPGAGVQVAAMGMHQALIARTQGEGDGVDEKRKVDPGKAYYAGHWDLGDLPAYQPAAGLEGTLRLPAGGYLMAGSVGKAWIREFGAFHPKLKIEVVEGRLAAREVDAQVGRKWLIDDLTPFHTRYRHSPFEIEVATGSFEVPGWSPALAILVHRDNPLAQMSLGQVDGVFGGARRGGWVGTTWRRDVGRGPEKNIRTWGQLGLGGEWAEQAIHVYGRPLPYYIMKVFETKVFGGGNIWNDNLREYPVRIRADGRPSVSVEDMIADLGSDRLGIAFCDLGSADLGALKPLAISWRDGEPGVLPTAESVRTRSYPLFLPVYGYADRVPGQPLEAKVREFLRFVLSREGQGAVQRDGKWLPLTAAEAAIQLRRLE